MARDSLEKSIDMSVVIIASMSAGAAIENQAWWWAGWAALITAAYSIRFIYDFHKENPNDQ